MISGLDNKDLKNKDRFLEDGVFKYNLIQTLMSGDVFGELGIIRKKINVGSIVGLFIETLILMPFALIGIYYLISTNKISFLHSSMNIDLMLSLGGLITIVPLLLFNGAATRMRLSTLGFFQYIGPSCSFFVAIFIYNEELNFDKLITFSLIWIALLIFSLD